MHAAAIVMKQTNKKDFTVLSQLPYPLSQLPNNKT